MSAFGLEFTFGSFYLHCFAYFRYQNAYIKSEINSNLFIGGGDN